MRQLRDAGADKVVREVASGDKTDRAQLRRLLVQLAAGDVVMVTRPDRLARSTRELGEHARGDHRQESWLSFACRRMGRHHDGARAVDADRPRRPRRVRARPNPRPHPRGTQARLGARRQARPETEIDRAPEARGDPPSRFAGQAAARERPQLQCQSQYDFATDPMKQTRGGRYAQ